MRGWTFGALLVSVANGCVIYKQADPTYYGSTISSPGEGREGDLEVSWQLGAGGCEAGGVELIEIDLGGFSNEFTCAEGSALITAPAGDYALSLRGLDADGIARYEGDGGRVTVRGGRTVAAPTVLLSALPVRIDASWYFDNGRLCSQNNVEQIELSLFDDQDSLQLSDTKRCDSGAYEIEEVEAGAYTLLLLGRAESGEVIYSGSSQFDGLRGDQITLDIPLYQDL